MRRIGLSQFVLLMLLGAVLAAGTAQADWSYEYADSFETDQAVSDSCLHSTFWSSDTSPLPEPYLYYLDAGQGRGVGFVDYKDQPAELGYCFPIGAAQAQREVKGTLELDVSFPSNETISQWTPGSLAYKTSSDGMAWSALVPLGAGHHTISISSASGTCYVTFSGTRTVIDNLRVSLFSPAVTIRVPENFATLQAAVNFAGNGDVIEVASGTYSGPGNWDIDFHGKAITLRSTLGRENTIIDCGFAHRGFYFHQGEGADTFLSGFTIRSGRVAGTQVPSSSMNWTPSPSHPLGGGIYCEFSSPSIADCVIVDCGAEIGGGIAAVGAAPTITNCLITECTAGGFGLAESGGRGGAIGLIRQSNAMIANCVIENNMAYYNSFGAGIYCWESTAVIAGSRIANNSAPGPLDGGGAYCGGSLADVVFQNCVFSKNAASAGAGLFAEWNASMGLSWQRAQVRVINCTIAQNQLSGAVGWPSSGGGIESSGADILIDSSILWYNGGTTLVIADAPLANAVTYSNIQGGYAGAGNISQNPLFANMAIEDYHLQSSDGRYDPLSGVWVRDNLRSPSIDAGNPSLSVTEESAPNGGRINMGAYGRTREASKSPEYITYHVDIATGRDWYNGRSRENAFATIQEAIDTARNGDTVLVWPGTYREDVNFNRKAITVRSAADAAVIEAPDAFAFSFFGAESSKSMLANFVIRRCGEGAVFCSQGASPTLKNLTIVENTYGIAAYEGADPYIVSCILWGNADGDLFGCRAHYSCVEHNEPDKGAGNINDDPLFGDPDNGDFHLMSRYGRYVAHLATWVTDYASSPCIDAGEDQEYPRAERTPNGGRMNMGAYGGTPYASLSNWPDH